MNRFLNTVKYLKGLQLFFHFYYKLRLIIRKKINFYYLLSIPSKSFTLKLVRSIESVISNDQNNFTFLNLSYHFSGNIDWNYSKFGKLWTYNLTYFDYLRQEGIEKRTGEALIKNFIDQIGVVKDGLEPFPISIRAVNWIKFLSQYKIKDQKIDDSLMAQYHILIDNLEFHLMGNHLLENAFSLLFGSYYFRDERLYCKAKKILIKELNEQILEDGAHFELSPMYHQLMLYRVLDCINLIKNNAYKNQELLFFFEEKAEVMLCWLNTITYKNGDIPLFNDSANGIAPSTKQLNYYANSLNLKFKIQNSKLTESGYRKVVTKKYEMVVDVGNIGPDYIPGHAHADTFNFELYIDKRPFIVDTGLSTYESNERRQLERATKSHNTVVVDGVNQSEVWGGFRVAERAKVIQLLATDKSIEAKHDGYKSINVYHTRNLDWNEKYLRIVDTIDSNKNHECKAYLHFHPMIEVKLLDGSLFTKEAVITFQGYKDIIVEKYNYAPEFNKTFKGQCAIVSFDEKISSEIEMTNKYLQ